MSNNVDDTFWKRLELFVKNVRVNDMAGQEEKDYILRTTKENIAEQKDTQPIKLDDLVWKCGDCGEKLTLVRPGKHQCDNEYCVQNIFPPAEGLA